MGAALGALAALEIAARGRGAALAGPELVGIHRKTHRTAGLAPVEASVDEDGVQALGLGLPFHRAGTGYDHRRNIGVNGLAVHDACDLAQILDPRIGAGADE